MTLAIRNIFVQGQIFAGSETCKLYSRIVFNFQVPLYFLKALVVFSIVSIGR